MTHMYPARPTQRHDDQEDEGSIRGGIARWDRVGGVQHPRRGHQEGEQEHGSAQMHGAKVPQRGLWSPAAPLLEDLTADRPAPIPSTAAVCTRGSQWLSGRPILAHRVVSHRRPHSPPDRTLATGPLSGARRRAIVTPSGLDTQRAVIRRPLCGVPALVSGDGADKDEGPVKTGLLSQGSVAFVPEPAVEIVAESVDVLLL